MVKFMKLVYGIQNTQNMYHLQLAQFLSTFFSSQQYFDEHAGGKSTLISAMLLVKAAFFCLSI